MAQPSQEVRELISTAVKHKRQRDNSDISSKTIAKQLSISEARLSSYNTGSRIPPKALAEKMGAYFFSTKEDRKQFVAALDKIRDDSRQLGRAGLLERLSAGEKLRVSTFKAAPFSGTDKAFFNEIFRRFFRLSGLGRQDVDQQGLDIHNALWSNKIDLALSCFASVDRSVLAHFWLTPIRLSLGAVILAKHSRDKKLINDFLCKRKTSTRFLPIVVKGEAGAIHCQETLDLQENQLVFEEHLNPERLAKRLLQLGDGSQVPVVVVDEYSSFGVLKMLRSKLGSEGMPVISLTSREVVSPPDLPKTPHIDFARRELPQYFLSFACSRKQQDLRDLIESLFFLFLSTELETTANALAALYDELMTVVMEEANYYVDITDGPHASDERKAKCFQRARGWTFYALGLERTYINEYPRVGMPWRPILERARQIIQSRLSDETITDQINFFAKYKGTFSHGQFHSLCQALDLPEPPLTYAQEQYVFEDRELLLLTIQQALNGRPVPPLLPFIEVFTLVQAQEKHLLETILSFLGEVLLMYNRELGTDNDASPKIVTALGELKQGHFEGFTSVVLASHGKPYPHYIGCAWLRPYKQHPDELELCYMFVRDKFRRLNIGHHILRKAYEYAQTVNLQSLKDKGKIKYRALIVEIPPQYLEGRLYFEMRGFTRIQPEGEHDRIVLEFLTENPFPEAEDYESRQN